MYTLQPLNNSLIHIGKTDGSVKKRIVWKSTIGMIHYSIQSCSLLRIPTIELHAQEILSRLYPDLLWTFCVHIARDVNAMLRPLSKAHCRYRRCALGRKVATCRCFAYIEDHARRKNRMEYSKRTFFCHVRDFSAQLVLKRSCTYTITL